MSQEIKTNDSHDLVGTDQDRGVYRAGEVSDFTPQQRDRLRALGGLDEASDGDLATLFEVSRRTGLDPFRNEIYLIGRRTKTGGYRGEPERWETKWTVQVSIGGLRRLFQESAKADGLPYDLGEPIFYDEQGKKYDIWLPAYGPHPAAVKVRVKIGENHGYGLASWNEFCQTKANGAPTSMWAKLGPTMLVKCAEAQAIRRVCSLAAGLYVADEMQQASNAAPATVERVVPPALGAAGLDSTPGDDAAPDTLDVPTLLDEVAALTSKDDITQFMADLQNAGNTAEQLADVAIAARNRWSELGSQEETGDHS